MTNNERGIMVSMALKRLAQELRAAQGDSQAMLRQVMLDLLPPLHRQAYVLIAQANANSQPVTAAYLMRAMGRSRTQAANLAADLYALGLVTRRIGDRPERGSAPYLYYIAIEQSERGNIT